MDIKFYVDDKEILERLMRIENQGAQLMATAAEIKATLAQVTADLDEIDGDVQELLDKIATLQTGATAEEVAEIAALATALKARTRATADKVPEQSI